MKQELMGVGRSDPDPMPTISSPQMAHARSEIQRIGTNTLPWLILWIQTEQHQRDWLIRFVHKSPIKLRDSPVVQRIIFGEDKRRSSYEGFKILGETARPALPQLISLTAHTNAHVAFCAIACIGCLGTNAAQAVPTLIRCAQNPNPFVAAFAFRTLGVVATRADISALQTNLAVSEFWQRQLAVKSIGSVGPAAHTAIPLLMSFLTDSDEQTRVEATNALLQIAPELLTNAPAN